MEIYKVRLLAIGLILLLAPSTSCGQSRQEKTDAIINKLNFVEIQKMMYEFKLEDLKNEATGNDSIKILELEKQLSDDEITKRVNSVLNETFTDTEIDELFQFVQSSAFDKFSTINKTFISSFEDIDKEIEAIRNNFGEVVEESNGFEPIPVDRENGFYATIGYNNSTDKDIILEDKPSLTLNDILSVEKKLFGEHEWEIVIVFTKDGAKKYRLLTKESIGKPIATVIGKRIVSMPTINDEITAGKTSISGYFSEEEIDKMIDILNKK